ncbi:myristoyl-CoA:protein N-myristoyltransferase, partial [Kipferlia bialata]|eukprot:g7606.t1
MSHDNNDEARTFWPSQPVPQEPVSASSDGKDKEAGPVTALRKPQRKDPYPLPEGLEWCIVDPHDAKQLEEVEQLLMHNYVEDDDNLF